MQPPGVFVGGLVLRYLTENQAGMIMDQTTKRGRGRPPHPDGALTNAARQRIFVRQRKRDTAELAYALKNALGVRAAREAFTSNYRGMPSGTRLRRVLASLLADDPAVLAFFNDLFSSGDRNYAAQQMRRR